MSINESEAGKRVGDFNLSPTTLLKIQKGDITRWFIDASSDAITVDEQQVAPLPLLNSKPYPAKHKILPLNIRGVTAYHLLNPLEEPHRVNPANERMLGGGGADGAIHDAAGPELRTACYGVPEVRPGVRCPTGEARITPGFELPASHVIHTVGPIYDADSNAPASLRFDCYSIFSCGRQKTTSSRHGTRKSKSAVSLSNAYRNSLRVARENNIHYIAFPAISCGVFGYPYEEAATVAISTIKEHCNAIKEVHFVLFTDDIYNVWLKKAGELLPN
ncbi:putative Macro domain-containing protein [Helianthus annuus]|nr:putative Macro domain-containing protein [Helianthus annuus]KAJ0584359.1 putative Macro domain-containing protein [Helianthus annuus]KAJ0746989.1 putative Macro domain-containing protein [Helianthus annuus]